MAARRFLLRNAHVWAPFFFAQAVLLYLGFFAHWFTFCILAFVACGAFSILFHNDVLDLFGDRPERFARLIFGLVLLICVAAFPYLLSWSYQTGRFGEPADNRYITIHKSKPSRVLLEFGVTTTPLENFDVVLRFSEEMCLAESDLTNGLGQPHRPEGPLKFGHLDFSGHSKSDKHVFMVTVNDRLTTHESVYLDFRSKLDRASALIDCRFQGPTESYSEGRHCADGQVKVVDLSGRKAYEPAPLGEQYSLSTENEGWCY